MAKKRKNAKGGSKQTSDSKSPDRNESSKNQARGGTRSSDRRKTQKGKGGKGSYNGDDYQLRRSVEADGSLEIVDMNADGNCLFRALSDQLYGDLGGNHVEVRAEVCDFMEENKDDFSVFLVLDDEDCADDEEDAADFESYVNAMRGDGEWGGNLELVAAARIYRRKITVFSASLAAFTIDSGEAETDGSDLLLSFHDNDHYNSVRNKVSPPKPISGPPKRKSGYKKASLPSDSGKKVASSKTDPMDVDRASTSKQEELTKSSATSSMMSNLSMDDDEIKPKDRKSQKATTKKSSPCPCGSGQKYRKCCWAKAKHGSKPDKSQGDSISIRASNSQKEGMATIDCGSAVETKGAFRVLNI